MPTNKSELTAAIKRLSSLVSSLSDLPASAPAPAVVVPQGSIITFEKKYVDLICAGKKTLVVNPDRLALDASALLLSDGTSLFGKLTLAKGRPMPVAEFRRRKAEHGIPDDERKKAWPQKRRLFSHKIEALEVFDTPIAKDATKPPEPVPRVLDTYYKRSLRKAELADLAANEEAVEAFDRIQELALLLSKRVKPLVEHTIEFMQPPKEDENLLIELSPIGRQVHDAYSQVIGMTGTVKRPKQPETYNSFVVAEELLRQMDMAQKVLPPRSYLADLARLASKRLAAFLKLEPRFQEGSRPFELPEAASTKKADSKPVFADSPVVDLDLISPHDIIKSAGRPWLGERSLVATELDQLDNQHLAAMHIAMSRTIASPSVSVSKDERELARNVQKASRTLLLKRGATFGDEEPELQWAPLPDLTAIAAALPDLPPELDGNPEASALAKAFVDALPKLSEAGIPVAAVYDLVANRSEEVEAAVDMAATGEHFLCGIDKAATQPHLKFVGTEKATQGVLQIHFRGKTAHADFRFKSDGHLIGYTMAVQSAGKVPELSSKSEAFALARKFDAKGSGWNKSFFAPHKIFTTLKPAHPNPWLKAHNVEFEPGEVGATHNKPGYMFVVAKPMVTRGTAHPLFHEYFLEGDAKFRGRLVFRKVMQKDVEGGDPRLESGRRPASGFWVALMAEDLMPYVLTTKAVRRGKIPPKGWSALPPGLKAVVPKQLRYWLADSEKERKRVRQELVKSKFFTRDNIKIVDGAFRRVVAKYFLYQPEVEVETEKSAEVAVEKRVGAQLWGSTAGKSNIAKPLSTLFPLHKRYVEPFAGGAALFYAKEPGAEEVLNDMDAEVAHAFQFVRDMTPQQHAALKRMNWVGSKEQYKKLAELDPANPIDRVYKFMYMTTFGFMRNRHRKTAVDPSRMGSKSTIPDRIDKTQARLQGVHISSTDYAAVIDKYDGPDTLFFLDPPYAKANQEVGESAFDIDRFWGTLKTIKGKFLATCDVPSPDSSGFQVRKFTHAAGAGHHGGTKQYVTYLISNYTLPAKLGKNAHGFLEKSDQRRDCCMQCQSAPEIECVWADGRGRAWFCKTHWDAWRKEYGFDINKHRRVIGGAVGVRYGETAVNKKLSEKQNKEYEAETAKIRENKKLPAAAKRHKFKAAEFTHKNGHPRCLICGDEPDMDGMCEGIEKSDTSSRHQRPPTDLEDIDTDIVGQDKNSEIRKMVGIVCSCDKLAEDSYAVGYAVGPVEADSGWSDTVEVGNHLYVPVGKAHVSEVPDMHAVATGTATIEVPIHELLYDISKSDSRRLLSLAKAGSEFVDRVPFAASELTAMLRDGETVTSEAEVRDSLLKRFGRPGGTCLSSIVKSSDDERYVLGVVLIPDVEDSQGDFYSAEEVRKASEYFMEFARTLGLMHESSLDDTKIKILENYIVKVDQTINGVAIKQGTWMLAARIIDDDLWLAVKTGRLTGWSIEGSAIAQRLR